MGKRLSISLFLILATLAVFWPVITYDFIFWDDNKAIIGERLLRYPSVSNTLLYWTEPHWAYLPLTYTVWSILAWLSKYVPAEPFTLNPGLFHAANLIEHLMTVLVVFSILKMLLCRGFGKTEDDSDKPDSAKVVLAAGAGTLVFALHPVQVETVVWITAMPGTLCGLFSFLSIREYLAFAFASKEQATSGRKNLHYVLACLTFLLALLSKPAAVVIPIVVLIMDRWVVGRSFKQSAISLVGWFGVAGLFAVIAKSLQHSGAVIITPPLWARPFIAGDALAFYFYKLVFPLQLGIDYGRIPDHVMQNWWGYTTWLVPFALAVALWFSKKREPWLVSLGIFVILLFPILGFVPFIFQFFSTVADHYLYMPMLGVALAVSWFVYSHPTKTVGTICAAVIILFGIRSSYHLTTWENDIALYANALKVNPVSFVSHNNMGLLLVKSKKFSDATAHFKKALKIWPGYPDANTNLGIILTGRGKLKEAIYHYNIAIQNRPGHPNANRNLGVALAKQGKLDEAIERYKESLKFEPDNEVTHSNLGVAYARKGNFDEAIVHFSEALKIKPNFDAVKKYLEMAIKEQDRKQSAHGDKPEPMM